MCLPAGQRGEGDYHWHDPGDCAGHVVAGAYCWLKTSGVGSEEGKALLGKRGGASALRRRGRPRSVCAFKGLLQRDGFGEIGMQYS